MNGAYTGARGPMQGLVAQADGGTLFFDEVHSLSPKGQATLLRFTEDHQYRPLGLARSDERTYASSRRRTKHLGSAWLWANFVRTYSTA